MLRVRRIVNSFFSSNTYLLSATDSNDCWLVDIGDVSEVEKYLQPKSVIKGLFLTHSHYDHIYGINELCTKHPQCIVYTSEFGKVALKDNKKNLSLYNEHPMIYTGGVCVLQDGDSLNIFGNIPIRVLATPGHCASCLSYVIGDNIFTGDSYIPNIPTVTNLPNGDKKEAKKSIEKIMSLSVGRVICPGHGPRVQSKNM